jgi:hypothetical protein
LGVVVARLEVSEVPNPKFTVLMLSMPPSPLTAMPITMIGEVADVGLAVTVNPVSSKDSALERRKIHMKMLE